MFPNNTFTLSYYPQNSEEIQVVANLPLERLAEAVANLRAAGF